VSVADVPELIDHGIKAYIAGRVGDALRSFQQVLEIDPGNPKAHSYLVLINGGATGLAPEAPRPVPLPGAAAVALPAPHSPAPRPDDPDFAPSPWDEGPAAAATYVLEPDGGLDLVAVAEKSDLRPLVPEGQAAPARVVPARNDVEVWLQAARELFALGDFSGSLELIEKILQVDPDHGEARDYLRQNEATLVAMYESKLGALADVPRLAVKPEEIMWLNLDHRAGFLLAQIDGTVDYDALFALSGLPRLDTARILARLLADGVIAV
jgi:tetratricopeptide (TPR) repeat protein